MSQPIIKCEHDNQAWIWDYNVARWVIDVTNNGGPQSPHEEYTEPPASILNISTKEINEAWYKNDYKCWCGKKAEYHFTPLSWTSSEPSRYYCDEHADTIKELQSLQQPKVRR